MKEIINAKQKSSVKAADINRKGGGSYEKSKSYRLA
jgi:hypothetical protein